MPAGAAHWRRWDEEQDQGADSPFKPLSPQQAQAWRVCHGEPWIQRVLWAQSALAAVAIAVAWVIQAWVEVGSSFIVGSVAWGAACAALPSWMMAWGLRGGVWARQRQARPREALLRWLVWEGAKVLLALAMLAAAPRVVPDLSWLGLLAGLVVVLKGYAVAALWPRRRCAIASTIKIAGTTDGC
ncbi:ATP synthase subunit I [Tepidimonas alkaliphilus]|uniref:ATP synthase subunit I n=1 Tax=Tepidimonas alkaliphilus TaxID=2588942 RepID=UPI001C8F89BB|nr:ATP synthase subunit I [Tepidimonas alkaliphilus]